MSKNSAKKNKEPPPEQPPPFAEFLLPPPTIAQVQQKIYRKRAAISAEQWDLQYETQENQLESCFKGIDALSISADCAIDLMLRVKTRECDDKEEALATIRAWFNLQPPLNPPQSLLLCPSPDTADLEASGLFFGNLEMENVAARDTAIAEYFYDALMESYQWGYNAAQSVHWLTLFAKTHEEYIDAIKTSKNLYADPSLCIQIFQRNLKGLLTYSIAPWSYVPPPRPTIFSSLEAKFMIDYFANTYVKHLRLLTHFFTIPRQVDTTIVKQEIQEFAEPSPLNTAIPAEKWDEYLVAEAEKAKKRREAELEAIDRSKKEAAERERKKQEDAQIAEMIRVRRQNMVITVEPLEPFPIPAPVEVVPEALFPVANEEDLEDSSVIKAPIPKEWPGLDPTIVKDDETVNEVVQNIPTALATRASIITRPLSTVGPTSGSGAGPQLSLLLNGPNAVNGGVITHPIKITADAPLNPPNIGALLGANTLPLISSFVQHMEKKIDFQTNEIVSRYQKLSSDRIAMKKYEKDEDDKLYAMQQQRATAAAAAAAQAAAEVKASTASLASRSASANAKTGSPQKKSGTAKKK
ncbi:UNVERIFIED_CONTAM: hypothetical protein HDU68_007306 [Siphonaria sp. JEL0065]|nr:hypothetical protein HDU68_007306 [Siphonaria sp. JEL0065]